MPRIRFTALATLVLSIIALPGEALTRTAGESASARLATQPEMPLAGERTALSFTLGDASGEPLQGLLTHHGRKVHVIIVSADMKVFGHIHPRDVDEKIEAGKVKVFFSFPRPGRYLVAVDYMTGEGGYAEQFTVEVADPGETAASDDGVTAPPSIGIVRLEENDRYTGPVVLDGSEEAGGYEVALQRPDRIKAGEPVKLTYRFTMDGGPMTDLRPYLEAPLHLAVVRDDLSHFLHEHGMLDSEAHTGHGEDADHASHDLMDGNSQHGHHGYSGPAEFGPEIMAHFSFPEPGTYYLFSQAAHGDTLLITRIPVEVE